MIRLALFILALVPATCADKKLDRLVNPGAGQLLVLVGTCQCV
jgi:hypothetical protein